MKYPRLLTGFDMLVFFINLLSLMEFQVRYLAWFLLFSVIDSFKWFWMGSVHKNIQLMLEFLKLHSWSCTFPAIHKWPSWWCFLWYCYQCWWYYSLFEVWLGIWFVATTWISFWTWIWETLRMRQEGACWFQCWENSTGFVWLV